MAWDERGAQGTPSPPRVFWGGSEAGSSGHTSIPSPDPPDGQDQWQRGSDTNQGPCPRNESHLLHPQEHTQMLQQEPCSSCCSSPDSARKARFNQIFQNGKFCATSVCDGGTLLSSSGSGQRFRQKAEQGIAKVVTHLALPSPPSPQILQELPLLPPILPTAGSLQPALLTQCWAESSACLA